MPNLVPKRRELKTLKKKTKKNQPQWSVTKMTRRIRVTIDRTNLNGGNVEGCHRTAWAEKRELDRLANACVLNDKYSAMQVERFQIWKDQIAKLWCQSAEILNT
jgi:hypothetical protein